MRKLGLGITFLLISTGLLAEPTYSRAYDICMDNSGGVTSEMINCIQMETKSQEARLNHVYRKLMSKLPPNKQSELRNTQRAWLKYKNSATQAEANQLGSLALITSQSLYLELTTTKADELQQKLEDLH